MRSLSHKGTLEQPSYDYDTSCSHGAFGSAFKHHVGDVILKLQAWVLVPPVQQLSWLLIKMSNLRTKDVAQLV